MRELVKAEKLYKERLKNARQARNKFLKMTEEEISREFRNSKKELLEMILAEIKDIRQKIESGRTGK